ncbi:cysteine-rich CWC family protein [Thalassotalea piscium]
MNENTELVDDTICPICQNKNLCQAHQAETCWCHTSKVPQDLIANVPTQLQGKSCICQTCIEQFNFELATRKI